MASEPIAKIIPIETLYNLDLSFQPLGGWCPQEAHSSQHAQILNSPLEPETKNELVAQSVEFLSDVWVHVNKMDQRLEDIHKELR